jgi:hypothetical protein
VQIGEKVGFFEVFGPQLFPPKSGELLNAFSDLVLAWAVQKTKPRGATTKIDDSTTPQRSILRKLAVILLKEGMSMIVFS